MNDALTMMEHGKMSLPEALKMGLSFIKTYQKSPSFELTTRRLENERLYKVGVLQLLEGIINASQLRR